jgi:hypothetical protein
MSVDSIYGNALLSQRVAIRYAFERDAMEFDTPEALKKYLQNHPGADKSKHSVKEKDDSVGPMEDDFSQSSDVWFDKIVDAKPDQKDPEVKRLTELVGKKPTKGTLDSVEKVVSGISAPWAKDVKKHIKKMRSGEFKHEFKKFDGDHSQTSELLSLLGQALRYND